MIILCSRSLYLILDYHFPSCTKMCILLVQCHHPHIWPTGLPLNLTFIWIVPSKPSLGSHPMETSYVPCSKSHINILSLRSLIQRVCPGPRFFWTFCNKLVSLWWKVVSPVPYPQAGGTSLVGCLRLLIHRIHSYSQLEDPYIHNPRTCHAVVTRDPPNMANENNNTIVTFLYNFFWNLTLYTFSPTLRISDSKRSSISWFSDTLLLFL
jgi:hypothetical protein